MTSEECTATKLFLSDSVITKLDYEFVRSSCPRIQNTEMHVTASKPAKDWGEASHKQLILVTTYKQDASYSRSSFSPTQGRAFTHQSKTAHHPSGEKQMRHRTQKHEFGGLSV